MYTAVARTTPPYTRTYNSGNCPRVSFVPLGLSLRMGRHVQRSSRLARTPKPEIKARWRMMQPARHEWTNSTHALRVPYQA